MRERKKPMGERDQASPALLERFEERAAIMEFHGGMSRKEAEDRAAKIVFGDQK